ncbi:MAG: hypothetical protein DHS20C15_34890 [Planctomycetota bacterium]|nr:MAG: hypothetical protein DHS20C15_34890 [Planctomycetota bacterium]
MVTARPFGVTLLSGLLFLQALWIVGFTSVTVYTGMLSLTRVEAILTGALVILNVLVARGMRARWRWTWWLFGVMAVSGLLDTIAELLELHRLGDEPALALFGVAALLLVWIVHYWFGPNVRAWFEVERPPWWVALMITTVVAIILFKSGI